MKFSYMSGHFVVTRLYCNSNSSLSNSAISLVDTEKKEAIAEFLLIAWTGCVAIIMLITFSILCIDFLKPMTSKIV